MLPLLLFTNTEYCYEKNAVIQQCEVLILKLYTKFSQQTQRYNKLDQNMYIVYYAEACDHKISSACEVFTL